MEETIFAAHQSCKRFFVATFSRKTKELWAFCLLKGEKGREKQNDN